MTISRRRGIVWQADRPHPDTLPEKQNAFAGLLERRKLTPHPHGDEAEDEDRCDPSCYPKKFIPIRSGPHGEKDTMPFDFLDQFKIIRAAEAVWLRYAPQRPPPLKHHPGSRR